MKEIAATRQFDLLVRLWRHLSAHRRRQFVLLMFLVVISAFAEVFTLGSVLPFLGIFIAPDKVFHLPLVAEFAQAAGISTPSQLILPLTVLFAVAALLSGAIRILLLWASTRLAYSTGSDLSIDVYRRTLYQPYSVHVGRNSSEVISGISNKVGDTVNVLNQALLLISSVVLLVIVTATLFAMNPVVALLATAGFGSSYLLITLVSRRRLERNGQRIAVEQTRVIKSLQEGLGGIRDVLLDGSQSVYCEVYKKADRALRLAQGNNLFIAGSPRYSMEALGMVLIAALACGISRQPDGISSVLPVLGTLALGAQRLLPALQQAYGAWTFIVGSRASVIQTLQLLDQPLPAAALLAVAEPLPLRSSAHFRSVSFRYASDGPWILDNLDFSIPRGARIGIVGATGSGKSTALDLLMGLLLPTEGEYLVDGEPVVGSRVRAWQMAIAHVPQSIFLADATIAENIAFGVPPAEIDMERVRFAAQRAQIADFIEGEGGGYDNTVGERGVRLSGGQRQRIGIARALYKRATVLVFDEATSALDNATEQSVMEAIFGLSRDLTVVLIAHRLSTVQRCDTIIQIEKGRLVAQGTYEQLLELSPSFRNMARIEE